MNDRLDKLRQQYGCGPVQFSGADEALYNRQPEQAIQQTQLTEEKPACPTAKSTI